MRVDWNSLSFRGPRERVGASSGYLGSTEKKETVSVSMMGVVSYCTILISPAVSLPDVNEGTVLSDELDSDNVH